MSGRGQLSRSLSQTTLMKMRLLLSLKNLGSQDVTRSGSNGGIEDRKEDGVVCTSLDTSLLRILISPVRTQSNADEVHVG